ncbi:NADP-dependent oxidoreductase domain-containing protein [Rhodofomes roseus]|uniref:NADP-dependent oxidoreductase domain-containing protein n=1 Tax=Rhodofomes roseus TaxID=34475 RepID=A0ABQ8KIY6_9APHY|nr:NADP-dependent oxidoreductase domain-containing protein [Rhodofomes roseus]KAH9837918.1 NADP-dependent oxidoreductase domain-containing protein [Rhodofomes roseus]
MAPQQKSALNIGMGALTFGKEGKEGASGHNLKDVEAILDVFQAHGHTEVDTSRVYNGGTSEEVLGAIGWQARGLQVETKLYQPSWRKPSPKSLQSLTRLRCDIRKHIEGSLKALNTDQLELWYLHGPDRTTPYEVTLKAVSDLYKEGKFRSFGISNYMTWGVAGIVQVCRANGYIQPTVYQGIYNAVHRKVEPELFPCLRKYGISFYEFNPCGGFFTGRYNSLDQEVEPGSRFDPSRVQGRVLEQAIFQGTCFDPEEIALRWISHHSLLKSEYGDAVIIGASSLNHIEQNMLDLEKGPLPEAVVKALDQAWLSVLPYAANYFHRRDILRVAENEIDTTTQLIQSLDTLRARFRRLAGSRASGLYRTFETCRPISMPPACLPPELLQNIFQNLCPHSLPRDPGPDDFRLIRSIHNSRRSSSEAQHRRQTLAVCARACRAFWEPAVRVLWREQNLVDFLDAVLDPNAEFGAVKGPAPVDDIYGAVHGGDAYESDDTNEDLAEADSYQGPYTYRYLSGRISPEDWSRFQRYAPFVQVLRYPRNRWIIDPSVFLYILQYAHGKPLFLNVRELVWEHATPEIISVISPSIRVLRLPEDSTQQENCGLVQEFAYRMRRHALKSSLPSIVKDLPNLEELELRSLGHSQFWTDLEASREPHQSYLPKRIHTLRIYESQRVLQAALAVVSKIEGLSTLEISLFHARATTDGDTKPLNDLQVNTSAAVRPFTNLRRLRINGPMSGVRTLLNAFVTPGLEDVELHCEYDLDDSSDTAEDVLHTTFDLLRRHYAASLTRLHFTLCDTYVSFFPNSPSSGAQFLEPGAPLLALRHLREVEILQHATDDEIYSDASILRLLEAWPALQKLILPRIIFSPCMLQRIARTCLGLRTFMAAGFSSHFVEELSTMSVKDSALQSSVECVAGAKPALREIRFQEVFDLEHTTDSDVSRIASFLDSLFPHLDVAQCFVPCFARATPSYMKQSLRYCEMANEILEKVKLLQLARKARSIAEQSSGAGVTTDERNR